MDRTLPMHLPIQETRRRDFQEDNFQSHQRNLAVEVGCFPFLHMEFIFLQQALEGMLLYKGGRENDFFRFIYMYFILGKISMNSIV